MLGQPLLGPATPRTPSGQARKRLIWDVTDSIDYHVFNNSVAHSRNTALREGRRRRRHIWGVSGRTFIAILTTLVSGVLIGITGKLMEEGVDGGVAWRNALIQPLLAQSITRGSLAMLGISIGFISVLVAAVQWLAPGAAGSGVSLVIAFLNGNNIAGLLTPATYLMKLLGPCLARTSGLVLGPEAPMIHLGACVSSIVFGLGRWLYTDTRSSKFESLQKDGDENDLDHDFLFSNASHRQIVSAGVAGGLAAAFGAPIGGVLFALEEACSVWSRKTAWRCLLCTATAVFTLSQLWPNASGTGILSLSGTYPLSSRQWLRQLPFVAVVAAIGGILGAAFNLMRRGMQRLRAARRRHGLRLLEAAAAAAITVGVVMAASAKYGMCLQVPPTWPPEQLLRVQCPEGQYNDLATTLLASAPFVIRGLLGLGSENEPINELCTLKTPCYFSPQALGITCIIYLMLMVLSSGLAVPGGLFMPSIMVGGTFGAMAGVVLTPVLPPSWDVQPGVYAMVGATATLSAVFRSNLSLVVIMVEGTGGLEYLPGILIAVLVSNFIAHWVHPDGVYESELERDGRVFFLRQEPPSALRGQIAEDIMAAPVVGLRRIEDVSRVIDVLCSTAHNGFPVHPTSALGAGAPENPARTMQLEGFILRSQLLVLLQERAFCDERGQYIDPHASPAAFEAKLDALMHAAAASSDGIVDATELGVDPLGTIGSGSEDGMTQAFIQTMETLETLRDMPTFAQLLHDDAGDGSQRLSPVSNVPDLYINLTPFMEKGMLAVRPDTPAMSVHQIFVAMSLRHLCVIDEATCVMGIITRKDLDNAAGHGWWRTNKIAPEPSREGMMGPPPSSSWLASSFQSLVVPPRRVLSDIVQRLSPSPRNASILADSDGSAHSERAALPVSAPANGTNDIEARHTPFGSHAC